MGKVVSKTLVQNKSDKCGKCGMKEDASKKGCCKDEKKVVKLDTDHQKSISDFNFKSFVSNYFLRPSFYYDTPIFVFDDVTYINFHPPPNTTIQKLHILYCAFLI
ncbi:MAG: hypothetical protein ABL929_08970 [Ferruginibacter sp.]|nr:hypothetical protein [Ferruginibacter sp.]